MKNSLRMSALACAALCFSFGLASTPAKADGTVMMPTYYAGYTYAPVAAYDPYMYDPYVYHNMGYVDYRVAEPVYPVAWENRWHYVHTQSVPSRFAAIDINEDDLGSLRHYQVTLNGQPVLFASNQPSILRVSRTFAMNGEDAVIFTAYHGDPMCSYKNYLLTVRADGTFIGPREIGNCASSYEAHVADNALFVSFPDGFIGDDVWRYENASLMRL